MRERVNLGKVAPALYDNVFKMDQLAIDFAMQNGWQKSFLHLLKLRASQINQCAFCIQMHTNDAIKDGESSERISLLTAWRETDYYSDKERAALALTEDMTLIFDGQLPDATYQEAAQILSDSELAAVEWLAIVINNWNRIAISSRYPVGPEK